MVTIFPKLKITWLKPQTDNEYEEVTMNGWWIDYLFDDEVPRKCYHFAFDVFMMKNTHKISIWFLFAYLAY